MDLISLRINRTSDCPRVQMQKNSPRMIVLRLLKTVIKPKRVLKLCHARSE
jgi:hypothetical protein